MCDIHSIQPRYCIHVTPLTINYVCKRNFFRKYFLAFVEMLLMNKYHIANMWKYLGGGIVSAL